jgi:AcrR family transcriptional regulator
MPEPVNPLIPHRRENRTRETERRILAAAHELFVANGWAGTTLRDVAATADVAERTVYVRFGTKGALLNRVIGAAVVGDVDPIPVRDRPWYRTALTAPTLEERIDAYAAGASALMSRAAPVIAVALSAMGDDAALADSAKAGHAGTREDVKRLWRRAHKDGLVPDHVNIRWLVETVCVILQADVYLLGVEVQGWTSRKYEAWLRTTLVQLLRT